MAELWQRCGRIVMEKETAPQLDIEGLEVYLPTHILLTRSGMFFPPDRMLPCNGRHALLWYYSNRVSRPDMMLFHMFHSYHTVLI